VRVADFPGVLRRIVASFHRWVSPESRQEGEGQKLTGSGRLENPSSRGWEVEGGERGAQGNGSCLGNVQAEEYHLGPRSHEEDRRLFADRPRGDRNFARACFSRLSKTASCPRDNAMETLENVMYAKRSVAEEDQSQVHKEAAEIARHLVSSVAAAGTRHPVKTLERSGD